MTEYSVKRLEEIRRSVKNISATLSYDRDVSVAVLGDRKTIVFGKKISNARMKEMQREVRKQRDTIWEPVMERAKQSPLFLALQHFFGILVIAKILIGLLEYM